MRRPTRALIVLAFAVATFATLRLTLGPRWARHGCHGAHVCWHQQAPDPGTTTGD